MHKRANAPEDDTRTLQDVGAAYNNSKVREEITRIMDTYRHSTTRVDSAEDYNVLLNWIITASTFQSFQRPGVIAHMTVQEFKSAATRQLLDVDGEKYYFIIVRIHKTRQEGPAPMFVKTDLYHQMEVYLKKFRPISAAHNFFISSFRGVEIKNASKYIDQFQKQFNLNRLNATDARKFFENQAEYESQSRPANKGGVIGCHSERTAETHYKIDGILTRARDEFKRMMVFLKSKFPNEEEEEEEEDEHTPSPVSSCDAMTEKDLKEVVYHSVVRAFPLEINTDILAIRDTHERGRMLIAVKEFKKGQIVRDYNGTLTNLSSNPPPRDNM